MSDKEIKNVSKNFKRLYDNAEATPIGSMIFKLAEDKAVSIIKELKLGRNPSIIDIGCGIGRTLNVLRGSGFPDSVGLDNNKRALELCSRKGLVMGEDVFYGDAKKTRFSGKKFDLVFEEGLLEHFKNFQPFVDEMCRISRKYVVLVQPNKFSISHRFMDIFTPGINIRELSYKIEDFSKAFAVNNFKLIRTENSFLNIFWILVFEKSS